MTDEPRFTAAELEGVLRRDLMLYGQAFVRSHPDGTFERLNPVEITVHHAPTPTGTWGATLLPSNPELAKFTPKELVAELRKRNHGTDTLSVDDLGKVLDGMTVGELGALRARVQSLYEYKCSTIKGLTPEELERLGQRDYVGAVRMIRDRTGLGFADAKKYLDKHKPGGA